MKHIAFNPMKYTPPNLLLSPCTGKVGMGVEQWSYQNSTPTLALMELLDIRLSPQAGKSLVIPLHGGGNQRVGRCDD
jgi:hypothetical protein